MLKLTLGQTDEYLVVTLNEKRTLDNGYYLFRFVHQTTRDVVSKVFSFLDDESSYQDRFNKFPFNTETNFSSQRTGFWNYYVYESSTSTTDPTGLTEVERGIMKLLPETAFAFEEYSDTTQNSSYFKTYNG